MGSADPHRKAKGSAYVLQLLLSDKYRYIKQEFGFFLGIANRQTRIAHRMVNQINLKNPRTRAGIPKFICGALAPCLANAPFVEFENECWGNRENVGDLDACSLGGLVGGWAGFF